MTLSLKILKAIMEKVNRKNNAVKYLYLSENLFEEKRYSYTKSPSNDAGKKKTTKAFFLHVTKII
jgi:hypothetical protein